jgi:BTB/POZ domain
MACSAQVNNVEAADTDLLVLNVGGSKLTVSRGTLTQIPESMLAAKFSGRWDDSLQRDHEGNIYLDHPMDLFQPIIDFLRCTRCSVGDEPLPSPSVCEFGNCSSKFGRFNSLVEFYGLSLTFYPAFIEYLESSPDDVTISGWQVHSPKHSPFQVVTQPCHCRRIKSFEVILNDFENFQVGWIYPKAVSLVRVGSSSGSVGLGISNKQMSASLCPAFSVGLSHALSPSTLSTAHSYKGIMPFPDGTRIRVERSNRQLSWAVNDAVLGTFQVNKHHKEEVSDLTPAFSGKGLWALSKIEYFLV